MASGIEDRSSFEDRIRFEEEEEEAWSTERSRDLYQVQGWGQPYFAINDKGHVEVRPDPSRDQTIDIFELTARVAERGLDLPILLRFPDILHHRIRLMNESFQRAIAEYDYKGVYRGVFPIKVNQQRHIVEEIVEAGKPWRYGLEAGSKPELLIALSEMDDKDGFIVCNGYKDSGFIETALIAQRFDNTVVIVLERPDEVRTVIEASERLGIRPVLGVRSKLASKGMGRWADSAGDRAKFGLTTPQIIAVVDELAKHDMLDCLQLLHFHIGSQVSSITPWKNALREAGHIYTELAKMGCKMGYLDVGGGLAVDYDGSKSDFHASMNYTVQEYANDVVTGIQSACDQESITHPTIVTESGRAVVSYQSVLIFSAVSETRVQLNIEKPDEDAPKLLHDMWDTLEGIVPKNVQESWHDANQGLEEARSLFRFGYLQLRELGAAETLFRACAEKIVVKMKNRKRIPEELANIDELFGNIYYCNFSLFQSAPDIWAMDQLFPIMPIHRLDERPTGKARLADLTCDSDGIIKGFIDVEDVKPALEVHECIPGEPYLMGMFLIGAYQEILGDLHNLFGDTNAVQIRLTDNGYSVSDVIKGDTVAEVLTYVQYDAEKMIERVRKQAERTHSEGRMTLEQMRMFMRHYEEAMRSYTYLK
jgi:arginine decarboxylase